MSDKYMGTWGKCQGCLEPTIVDDINLCVDCGKDLEVEFYAEMKQERKKKKLQNAKSSLSLLDARGIKYEKMKGNMHYKIGDWNFYPSTGVYFNQKTYIKGRGVFNLLRELKNEQEKKVVAVG